MSISSPIRRGIACGAAAGAFWGLVFLTPELVRFKQAVVNAAKAARDFGFADETNQIVVMAGVPFNQSGTTNILRIAPCDERLIYRTDPE